MKGTSTLFSNVSTDWCTPKDLFQDIKETFGIELDPCAHETELLPVEMSLSKEDDGLKYEWHVNTFINPPYSSIEVWVDKTIEEYKKNPKCSYVMLLPSRTDRLWFRKVLGCAEAVCFISKRLKFSNAKNNAPFPSLIAVFKKDFTDEQLAILEKYGYVI
jgi:phage N-6-adenine-methyltransferase